MYIHCTEKKVDLEFVTLDQSFKLIQGLPWHNNAGWLWVPDAYCLWKETVLVVFSCAVGLEMKFVGGPSYFLLMRDILVRINGYNIVGNFIKHRDSGSHRSLFENLLIQVAYHVGYTACVYGIDQIQSVLLSSALFTIHLLVCGDLINQFRELRRTLFILEWTLLDLN